MQIDSSEGGYTFCLSSGCTILCIQSDLCCVPQDNILHRTFVFCSTASILGAFLCTLIQFFTVLLNTVLWLPELDAVFLESSAQPHILLCACIFPVYMLNSYLYPLTAPTELSCDLLVAFLGCSFKDRLIFRGLSTQGIPRSVTFHLHPVLLVFCGLFHFHK